MANAPKFSKSKNTNVPSQPEGVLGDVMIKHGNELGTDVILAEALLKMGETFKELAENKNGLDTAVKMEFIEPLVRFQNSELKEISHYRKKLHDARVDYDFKKRKVAKGSYSTREELKVAEEKLEETVNFTHMRMHNLILNEVDVVTQLTTFARQLQQYHQHCNEILNNLVVDMNALKMEAANKPKPKYEVYNLEHMGINRIGDPHGIDRPSLGSQSSLQDSSGSASSRPLPPQPSSPLKPPAVKQCEALYDFQAENPGELSFSEGDKITLIRTIDENWCEGQLHGQNGFFPLNHVKFL
ncbi:hypothetical protein CHUAL_007179 [Chamberlinius hualienensis]